MSRLFPFWIFPAAWGLKGVAYEEAEACYNLNGEELERKLAQIRYSNDSKALANTLNDLDLKYNHVDLYRHATVANQIENGVDTQESLLNQINIDIKYDKLSPYDGDVRRIEFKYPSSTHDEDNLERKLALLKVEYEYRHIEKNEYEKQCASLKNEPWVSFVDSGFDLDKGINGFRFELDYNPQWIDYLKQNGFIGNTDEQVLEDWFTEICRSNMRELDPTAVVLNSTVNS